MRDNEEKLTDRNQPKVEQAALSADLPKTELTAEQAEQVKGGCANGKHIHKVGL
jgi:hypothetical protein